MLRILDVGLHVGHAVGHASQSGARTSSPGAKNLGISDRYGIAEGKPANCIVLDCSTDKEAVQCQPDVLCSVHNGKTVFTRKPAAYTTTMDGFAAS